MARFVFDRFVSAPPELVFDVLTDHRAYAEFTPLRRAELERQGEPAPNGVGAIRVLSLVGPKIREEVTAFERPTRFAYRMLSGAPTRDHTGTVSLTPEGEGTRVNYVVETTPTVPVIGRLITAVVRSSVGQLIKGVAGEAERRARAGSAA